MRNPWTRKNPFMSMWLSGANAMLGKARGHTAAAVRREANRAAATAIDTAGKQVADFWDNVLNPPMGGKRRKRR